MDLAIRRLARPAQAAFGVRVGDDLAAMLMREVSGHLFRRVDYVLTVRRVGQVLGGEAALVDEAALVLLVPIVPVLAVLLPVVGTLVAFVSLRARFRARRAFVLRHRLLLLVVHFGTDPGGALIGQRQ